MKLEDYRCKIKMAFILSWICTVASVLLAILPSLLSLVECGETTLYNPELAILTATLIGLVWYVFWTYRMAINPYIEKLEVKLEYKTSLATALLVELQWSNRHLREIYKGEVWAFDPISYPLLLEAEHNLNVFSPNAITRIASFHNRILLFQNSFKDEINGFNSDFYNAERIESHKKFNKMKAFLAIEALNDLVVALQDEGGVNPPALKGIVVKSQEQLPDLPIDLFSGSVFREKDDLKSKSV